jgi:hypothetical protein
MIRAPLDEHRARKPAGAEFWHVWTVYIPRRSITGKLVWGRVWRRDVGRHWIYKRIANDAEAQRRP